jgi:hypothetical protein
MTEPILDETTLHLQPSLETRIYIAHDGVIIDQKDELGEESGVWISPDQIAAIMRHLERLEYVLETRRTGGNQ